MVITFKAALALSPQPCPASCLLLVFITPKILRNVAYLFLASSSWLSSPSGRNPWSTTISATASVRKITLFEQLTTEQFDPTKLNQTNTNLTLAGFAHTSNSRVSHTNINKTNCGDDAGPAGRLRRLWGLR